MRVEGVIGQLRRWWWAAAPLQDRYSVAAAEGFANQLFGAAGKENTSQGQGAVLISLTQNSCAPTAKAGLGLAPIKELFGPLYGSRAQALAPGRFTLRFVLRPKHDAMLMMALAKALQLWGLLGGLGAGQNRGFGSVRLLSMAGTGCEVPEFTPPDSLASYKDAITKLIGAGGQLPTANVQQTFDAFTRNAAVFSAAVHAVVVSQGNGLAVLQKVSTAAVAVNVARRGSAMHDGWHQPHTIRIFSGAGARNPSPYHFHVAPLGNGFILLVTTLIRSGGVDTAISEIEGPAGHNLFSMLGLARMWP